MHTMKLACDILKGTMKEGDLKEYL